MEAHFQKPFITTSKTSPNTFPLERLAINLSWICTLRWTAIIGQLLTIGIVRMLLDNQLHSFWMIVIIFITTVTNFGLRLWLQARERHGWIGWQHSGEWLLRVIMILDTVFLTGILYLSGGPTNPFAVFYLINIALAAVVLEFKWTCLLCGLALSGYSFLYWKYIPVGCLGVFGRWGSEIDEFAPARDVGCLWSSVRSHCVFYLADQSCAVSTGDGTGKVPGTEITA